MGSMETYLQRRTWTNVPPHPLRRGEWTGEIEDNPCSPCCCVRRSGSEGPRCARGEARREARRKESHIGGGCSTHNSLATASSPLRTQPVPGREQEGCTQTPRQAQLKTAGREVGWRRPQRQSWGPGKRGEEGGKQLRGNWERLPGPRGHPVPPDAQRLPCERATKERSRRASQRKRWCPRPYCCAQSSPGPRAARTQKGGCKRGTGPLRPAPSREPKSSCSLWRSTTPSACALQSLHFSPEISSLTAARNGPQLLLRHW